MIKELDFDDNLYPIPFVLDDDLDEERDEEIRQFMRLIQRDKRYEN